MPSLIWLQGATDNGCTISFLNADQPDVAQIKYSYAKAPRYQNRPTQVGPLARQINDQDPLVLDLAKNLGVNAFTRELARLHEEVRLLAQLKTWLGQLNLREPFYRKPPEVPHRATGYGLTEAGRGALGRWIRIEGGRSPTTKSLRLRPGTSRQKTIWASTAPSSR